jgi:hypothetical protein
MGRLMTGLTAWTVGSVDDLGSFSGPSAAVDNDDGRVLVLVIDVLPDGSSLVPAVAAVVGPTVGVEAFFISVEPVVSAADFGTSPTVALAVTGAAVETVGFSLAVVDANVPAIVTSVDAVVVVTGVTFVAVVATNN